VRTSAEVTSVESVNYFALCSLIIRLIGLDPFKDEIQCLHGLQVAAAAAGRPHCYRQEYVLRESIVGATTLFKWLMGISFYIVVVVVVFFFLIDLVAAVSVGSVDAHSIPEKREGGDGERS